MSLKTQISEGVLGLVLGLLISVFILISVITCTTESTYKSGQVDAINGKIMYQLTTTENGETVWSKTK